MKRLCYLILLSTTFAYSQTNTFPASGNVGIGTTTPGAKLSFNNMNDASNLPSGISWFNTSPLDYAIHRTAGTWVAPDYQQLKINFQTGIILNPGTLYSKSFVDVQGGGLRVTSGAVGIGVTSPHIHSKFHLKAPSATPWALLVEANASDKIIGLSHDGTYGLIAVSYTAGGAFSPLQFRTSNLARMTLAVNGNVGVGTETPLGKLHVSDGDLLLQNSTSGYPSLYLKDVSGANSLKFDYNSIIGAGSKIYIRSGSNPLVLNDVGGNVGIGTATPNQKLTVNGTIYGKEIKVDLSVPGPDYVFENDYKLPSLQELHTYITINKHLPEVPSAQDMKANGILLGEMNMILLKKIEELTLHLIEKEKQMISLEDRIKLLEQSK